MATRANLHKELKELLGSDNVYYQPPESIKLKYPCIIYERDVPDTKKADDRLYLHRYSYAVTIIDREADSSIGVRLAEHFPYSRFSRHFVSDKLYHEVYNIYY